MVFVAESKTSNGTNIEVDRELSTKVTDVLDGYLGQDSTLALSKERYATIVAFGQRAWKSWESSSTGNCARRAGRDTPDLFDCSFHPSPEKFCVMMIYPHYLKIDYNFKILV